MWNTNDSSHEEVLSEDVPKGSSRYCIAARSENLQPNLLLLWAQLIAFYSPSQQRDKRRFSTGRLLLRSEL
jgi:hypothetical protein